MFIIFLNLMCAAYPVRITLAIRPTPSHTLTLPSTRSWGHRR
jgi:hypothetical protein